MKSVSMLVTLAGVLALILGGVERVMHRLILDIAPTTYLNVAATLFLLALVLIAYDRSCGFGKKE